jgi:hypothetical protein
MGQLKYQVGDLAHCALVEPISAPFVGKVVAEDEEQVCLEVLFIPNMRRDEVEQLHSKIWLDKSTIDLFWRPKSDL